jgi:hypothetical protein
MPSERIYRTESGSYAESELAVIVWANPDQEHHANARLLVTVTDRKSPNPMAFPIKTLKDTSEFVNARYYNDDFATRELLGATLSAPAVIPLPLARKTLGWTDFYIPTRYEEAK